MSDEHISVGEGGESTTISNTNPVEGGQSLPDFKSIVPSDYADKQWVSEVKDIPTMFKMVEDQRTAISKRPAGIPQNDASEDEWGNFNKTFGVPETADGYTFAEVEGGEKNEAYESGMKALLHKAGISERQFGILEPGFNELMTGIAGDPAAKQEVLDKQFDELSAQVFGDGKDKALEVAKGLIAKYRPESMNEHIANMSNNDLIVMASVLNGIQKDYISEDSLPSGDGLAAVGMSEGDRRAKGLELMNSKAYQDQLHPDHNRVREQVNKLYGTHVG